MGYGEMAIGRHPPTSGYAGKLNFYDRCIRGSVHSSGKCYDCEVLYRAVSRVYRLPLDNSPSVLSAALLDEFLDSRE